MKHSKRLIICLLLLVSITAIFIAKRENILRNLGYFLYKTDKNLIKSDIIVILRGDSNYSRVLQAADLFHKGLSDVVFVSSSLLDIPAMRLKKYGVNIPTRQQLLVSTMTQLGIPEDKIMFDTRFPGGGTRGELERIRKKAKEHKWTKIIIITSWYHTRRTRLIAESVFKDDSIDFFVVATMDDVSNPSNWWQYRYESIYVLEEFPKLIIFYLSQVFKLSFTDDPTPD